MLSTFVYATLAAGILTACSITPPVAAQTPVHWTISPLRSSPRNGASVNVRIDAKIQDGWHIYSITQPSGGPFATRITVPAGQPFVAAGDPKPTPAPRVAFDDAFHMNVQLHETAVGYTGPVRFAPSAATPGRRITAPDSVRVNVRYQVCNASLCLPPQTEKLAAPIAAAAR
jgi:DsbC/DsbD-like thiol-disulfide interchange protein